jgi:hypothetical protein
VSPAKEHSYGKVKGKGVIFLTGHIQCKQSLSPRSLELRGNFHIFEKTLKIELSPIPQAYPLNTVFTLKTAV